MRKTSFDELYAALGAVVLQATGRKWWRKGGIQAQPVGPYATVLFAEAGGVENEVVETVELAEPPETGEELRQVPWNTSLVPCRVEFYRSAAGDSALDAATRLRSALRLEERYWDLWQIAGLSGAARLIDVSGAFRADIEPRAELQFNLVANLADPPPLAGDAVSEIDSQQVDVTHVRLDDLETAVSVAVAKPAEES